MIPAVEGTKLDAEVAAPQPGLDIPVSDVLQYASAQLPERLQPYLKRNVILFLTGSCIFGLGWGMAQVPGNPLLSRLGVSNTSIGFIGTLAAAFSIVGPIISAAISRRFARKKWLVFVLSQPYLMAPGLMGVSVILCTKYHRPEYMLPLLLSFKMVWDCIPSLFQTPKSEFIGQTIAPSFLGRYFGLEGSVAPFTSLFGTAIAGYLLAGGDTTFSQYAGCLLLGYAIAQVGGSALLFAHEVPLARPAAASDSRASFTSLLETFWNDRYYRPFLLFVFALCVLRAPFGFVPFYGFKVLHMDPSRSAVFIYIYSVTQMILGTPTGWLCDKWGSGRMLAVGLALQIVTIVPLCFVRTPMAVYSYLAIDQASMTVTQIACMAFILRYARPELRGVYVAAYGMIQAIAAIIVITPFGMLVDHLTYERVFWIWSGLHIVVLLIALEAVRRGVARHMFEKVDVRAS
jgi:MFS family permease